MNEKKRELRFEEALAQLEKIVADMEAGELSLDESMKKFEEGMQLTRFCSARLGEAEKKVEVLLRKADGTVEWQKADVPDSGADADAGEDEEEEPGERA